MHLFGSRYTKNDKKTRHFELTCIFRNGFMSDGASAPELAKEFVPDIKLGDNSCKHCFEGNFEYK